MEEPMAEFWGVMALQAIMILFFLLLPVKYDPAIKLKEWTDDH